MSRIYDVTWSRCLRKPSKTKTRQASFLPVKRGGPRETDKMKSKIDTYTDAVRAVLSPLSLRRYATG